MLTRPAVLLAVIAMTATAATAQTTTAPVANAGEALRNVMFGSETSPTGALSGDAAEALTGLIVIGVASETSSIPFGSSAAGFTWVFDSKLRVPVRRSQSFGPMFAERPFTTGNGKLNVGMIFQHTSFTALGDQPLWTSSCRRGVSVGRRRAIAVRVQPVFEDVLRRDGAHRRREHRWQFSDGTGH